MLPVGGKACELRRYIVAIAFPPLSLLHTKLFVVKRYCLRVGLGAIPPLIFLDLSNETRRGPAVKPGGRHVNALLALGSTEPAASTDRSGRYESLSRMQPAVVTAFPPKTIRPGSV